jgi:hypothetical protein
MHRDGRESKAGRVGRGPEHKEVKGDRVGKAGRMHRVVKEFKAGKAGKDYKGFKPPQDNSTDAISMIVLLHASTRDPETRLQHVTERSLIQTVIMTM